MEQFFMLIRREFFLLTNVATLEMLKLFNNFHSSAVSKFFRSTESEFLPMFLYHLIYQQDKLFFQKFYE
jgi:hypothetical protein